MRLKSLALLAAPLVAVALSIQPAAAAGFAVAQPVAPAPLAGKTIVVDPGHGGWDTGAIANGFREKDLTLSMGLALQALLQSRGARVVMTRSTDTALAPIHDVDDDLQARVNTAQQAHANAFVSVHVNANPNPDYSGATTYYGPSCGYRSGASESAGDVGRSYSLGRRIQAELVAQTGEVDHGTRGQIYWVLGDAGIPSVLVETALLTNAAEAAKISNPAYQAQVVHAIADGITDFFASGDQNRDPGAPASAIQPCTAPPPAQEPSPANWVETFLPAALTAAPDPNATLFTVLPPFSYLQVLSQTKGYLYVLNPQTNGPGYVEASKVGPSGPPPSFQPFWVENFRATGVWSAPSGGIRFGVAPQWSKFQVVKPQDGPRLFVIVQATGNVAYVDASDVGPINPPA
ncbi:MAG TPA: N-acetylmuramoyl-L-alanine amidase [Chloroflexota bacterium]|nr:N-acetylmuramoyl-L-alanine amidase [Chloroflexota bacterium]